MRRPTPPAAQRATDVQSRTLSPVVCADAAHPAGADGGPGAIANPSVGRPLPYPQSINTDYSSGSKVSSNQSLGTVKLVLSSHLNLKAPERIIDREKGEVLIN